MRSADKVTLVNAMNGTNSRASTAAGAFRIINGSEIVNHVDCIVGTGFFALFTADTAVGAIFSYVCARVVIGAFDNYARGIVYKVNDAVGADARRRITPFWSILIFLY